MDAATSFVTHWYYHIPNYVLALLLYAVVGRFILSLIVPENFDNFIYRGFIAVSDPVVRIVRFVTPDAVPPPVVLIFTLIWLMVIRVWFFFEMARWGLAPRIFG